MVAFSSFPVFSQPEIIFSNPASKHREQLMLILYIAFDQFVKMSRPLDVFSFSFRIYLHHGESTRQERDNLL